ncbi:hypothetical protein DPEC_G00270400 [Dallia pectoralis]|uniref:Uncharacterized protein n=1 Tax=Dallia pectoralis TaxID=75939 RepID=A0ACC2FPS5_DALPE|nr:hypothetical protein DPEC_G00270400 [Dallia pectoralis]
MKHAASLCFTLAQHHRLTLAVSGVLFPCLTGSCTKHKQDSSGGGGGFPGALNLHSLPEERPCINQTGCEPDIRLKLKTGPSDVCVTIDGRRRRTRTEGVNSQPGSRFCSALSRHRRQPRAPSGAVHAGPVRARVGDGGRSCAKENEGRAQSQGGHREEDGSRQTRRIDRAGRKTMPGVGSEGHGSGQPRVAHPSRKSGGGDRPKVALAIGASRCSCQCHGETDSEEGGQVRMESCPPI